MAVGQPMLIVPFIFERPHDRRGPWRHLATERQRIAFVRAVAAVARGDVEFVAGARSNSGNEAIPDAGRATRTQRVTPRAPAVEIAHHTDMLRIRCPHGE